MTTAIHANLHGNTRTVLVCVLCMSYSVSGKDLGQEGFFLMKRWLRYDKESVISISPKEDGYNSAFNYEKALCQCNIFSSSLEPSVSAHSF